eukprot:6180213-Pleurochrysis_carterae.AAC.2
MCFQRKLKSRTYGILSRDRTRPIHPPKIRQVGRDVRPSSFANFGAPARKVYTRPESPKPHFFKYHAEKKGFA